MNPDNITYQTDFSAIVILFKKLSNNLHKYQAFDTLTVDLRR